MVDKEGNAKIMDFGIARSLRTAGMTAEGMIIGTPEYMAPEQVEGQEADQRTDIYALGAILFEMVTGRVPFEGDSPLSVAYKHKNEMPIAPRKLNAEVPEPLSGLILRCLEKEKENRYQTADEVLADLIRVEDGLPISERVVLKARPTIHITREKPTGLRRFLVPALVLLGLVIAAGVVWRFLLRTGAAPASKVENSIAVISFENQTGDKAYDNLGKVIQSLLITNLEQSGYFYVATWERLRELRKQLNKENVEFIDPDLGLELCKLDGVKALVLGSYAKAGNTFVTNAQVLEVGTKNLLGTARSKGEGPDSVLNKQIDELSRQIAKSVGLSERKIKAAKIEVRDVTTSSQEAYKFYLKGKEEDAYWHDLDAARQSFEKAVELDPTFAAAWSSLVFEYAILNNPQDADRAIKKAMNLSKKVTERERLWIESSYADKDRKRS